MILLWLIIIILYSCYKVSSVLESSSSAEARLINQLPSTQPNQCCPSPLSSFAIFYPYFINPFRAYFFSTSSTFWWPCHQWYWWPSIDRGRGPLTICPVCDANPKYQSKTRKIATNTIPTLTYLISQFLSPLFWPWCPAVMCKSPIVSLEYVCAMVVDCYIFVISFVLISYIGKRRGWDGVIDIGQRGVTNDQIRHK